MDKAGFKYTGEKFLIYWDPEEKILFEEFWGEHHIKDAEDYQNKFSELAAKIPGNDPINILADVSKQKKTDHEARRIYTKISSHPRSGNSAICGANLVVGMIANFIGIATRRKNIKCFSTRDEGLSWLREIKGKITKG